MGCLTIYTTLVLTIIPLVLGHTTSSIPVHDRYCVPNCDLPAAGRRYCQTVIESASCKQDVTRYLYTIDKADDKLPFACGCFWENSLRSITGQITQNKPLKTCLLLTSLLCAKYSSKDEINQLTIKATTTTQPSVTISSKEIKHLEKELTYLLTLQKQILQLPDGKNKQLAEAALEPKIKHVLERLKEARLKIGDHRDPTKDTTFIANGHLDNSDPTNIQTMELDREGVNKITAKEGWNYMSNNLKKKLEHDEHNKDRDREFKLLLSFSCVATVILLLILALLAKAKGDKKDAVEMDSVGDLDLGLQRDVKITCWDTFLEKLRNHYKQREEEDLLKQSGVYGSISGSGSGSGSARTGTKVNPKSIKPIKIHDRVPTIKVTDFDDEDSDCEEEEAIFQTKLLNKSSMMTNKSSMASNKSSMASNKSSVASNKSSNKSTVASYSVEDHVIHHS